MSAAELGSLLRAAVPGAPDTLRARVAALQPRPRRLPGLPPRRLLLPVASAAAALAVGAAFVHGLTSSSPRRPVAHAATTVLGQRHNLDSAAQPAGVGAVTGAPAWTSAGGVKSAAPPSLTPSVRLQRFAASLRLRVDGERRLSEATAQATRIARAFGGYAGSVEYRTPAGGPGQAFLELRIPTARVQGALARLSALGTILSQQVSVQDLQRDLERETVQIAQLRQTIRLTLAALNDPAVTPVQRVTLQIRLAAARRALAQRTHARGATIAEGTLARVSLVLTTTKPAPAAAHRGGRLDRMLGNAIRFLGLEATIALYALIVVSPAALVALVLLGTAWLRRRRDERRLLAAS
jgi:hypothetical protein